MAAPLLMTLTRVDGDPIVIVRSQVVSWSPSLDHDGATTVHFVNGHFQDVTEKIEEIGALYSKGMTSRWDDR